MDTTAIVIGAVVLAWAIRIMDIRRERAKRHAEFERHCATCADVQRQRREHLELWG